jgi:hypothetical protein
VASRSRNCSSAVTVAGHHKTIVVVGKLENGRIGGLRWEYVAEAQDFVIEFSE